MIVQMLFALAMMGVAIAFGTEASGYRWTAARTPMILAWIVGLLALLMFVEAAARLVRARRGAGAAPEAAPTVSTAAGGAEASLARGLAFLAAVLAYTLTFRTVGFVLGSVLFLAGTMLVVRATRPLYALAATAAGLAVIYAVFVAFLRLPIPLWPRV